MSKMSKSRIETAENDPEKKANASAQFRLTQQIIQPRSVSFTRTQGGPSRQQQTINRRHTMQSNVSKVQQRMEVQQQFYEFQASKQEQVEVEKRMKRGSAVASTVDETTRMTLIKESDIESKETISLITPGEMVARGFQSSEHRSIPSGKINRNKTAEQNKDISMLKFNGQLNQPEVVQLPKTQNATPSKNNGAAHQKMEVEIRKMNTGPFNQTAVIGKGKNSRGHPIVSTFQKGSIGQESLESSSAAKHEDSEYSSKLRRKESKQKPSLHTSYPFRKNKPIKDAPKHYENLWETSTFYPATVNAKSGLPQVVGADKGAMTIMVPQEGAAPGTILTVTTTLGAESSSRAQQNQQNQSMISQPNQGGSITVSGTQKMQSQNYGGTGVSHYETFDSNQPYKQVMYNESGNKQRYYSQTAGAGAGAADVASASFTKSTMSASAQEPFVANLEASMFYSRIKSGTAGDDATTSLMPRSNRRHTIDSGFQSQQDSKQRSQTTPFTASSHQMKIMSANMAAARRPEEAERILNTNARNAAFKINMPHSQARMPDYLPREQIRPKQQVAQRKHVHSFIYPSKFDMLRYEMKMKLHDKLAYQQTEQAKDYDATSLPVPPNNQLGSMQRSGYFHNQQDYDVSFAAGADPASLTQNFFGQQSGMRQTGSKFSNGGGGASEQPVKFRQIGVKPGDMVELTTENMIPMRALRQTLDKTHEMLKEWKEAQAPAVTTFTHARRFQDPQVMYGDRMAKFSLIDINDHFKPYNGAPKLDKYSFRPDFFVKKGPETEEELLVRRNLMNHDKNDMGENENIQQQHDIEQKPSFHPKEHSKIKNMKPYIKQIISDMKSHTTGFEL